MHTLDLSQVAQTMRWLDEEQRKNKTTIAELQRLLAEQRQITANQSQRLQELEQRLKETRTDLYRLDILDKNIEQTRAEANALLPKFEHLLREAITQTTQSRLTDHERNARAIQELSAKADAVPELMRRIEQNAQAYLADRERDSRAIQELVLKLETLPELIRRSEQHAQTYLADRERDLRTMQEFSLKLDLLNELARRVETLTAEDRRLNEQFQPVHARLEQLAASLAEHASRFPYLEEWSERVTKQIAELKFIEERIKVGHENMLELIRRAEAHQQQQLTQLGQDMGAHRKQVDDTLRALPPIAEIYDHAKRVLAHYEGLEDDIRGEQARIAHLLELSEERLRETLAQWRSEYERNWEHHLTVFELYRKQQRELTDTISARLETLEREDTEHTDRWAALRESWAAQTKRHIMELERTYQELEASVVGKKQSVISNQ
jgi:hypothetical protein